MKIFQYFLIYFYIYKNILYIQMMIFFCFFKKKYVSLHKSKYLLL